jgi:hypothetical protein
VIKNSRNWKIITDMIVEEEDEQWDYCPDSLPEEIFLSWFTRLAKENMANTLDLYQQLMNINNKGRVKLLINSIVHDTRRKIALIEKLKQFIDVDSPSLKMLPCQAPAKTKDNFYWDYLNIPLESPRFCPYCLKGDSRPYIRYYWHLRFVTVCIEHDCLLLERCPHCYSKVKYWETEWDQNFTQCMNCGGSLVEDIGFMAKHPNTEVLKFQNDLLNVYKNKAYNGKNMDPRFFFGQLWKIVVQASIDIEIKEMTNEVNQQLSTDRLFKALLLAYNIIQEDPERINKPFSCTKDSMKFATVEELLAHQKSGFCTLDRHIPGENGLTVANRRYNIIQPLLENSNRTREDIQRITRKAGISSRTIYHWIKRYEIGGLSGLIPQRHRQGNRTRRFGDKILEIQRKYVKEHITDKKKSIKGSWGEFTHYCRGLRYKSHEIPGYMSFSKELKKIQHEGIK